MVRVAGLHDQVEGKIDARGADGMAAADVIKVIHDRGSTCALAYAAAEEIRPSLAEHGIRIISSMPPTRRSARSSRSSSRAKSSRR